MSEQRPNQPILLPLVVRCPTADLMGDVLGAGVEPTIQVQLDTLGGQVYLIPMSVRAARDMLVALTNWPPAIEAMQQETPQTNRSRNDDSMNAYAMHKTPALFAGVEFSHAALARMR
jgi:hypothetical protein